jgi:hypothetical protein
MIPEKPSDIIKEGGNLIEKAGNAGDKLTTSDDERQKNEVEAMKVSAGINAIDMQSDLLLPRITRPVAFLSTLFVFLGIFIYTTVSLLTYKAPGPVMPNADQLWLAYVERLNVKLLEIFLYLLVAMGSFYFYSRLSEKKAKIKAGIYEPKTTLQKKGVKGWFKSLWGGDDQTDFTGYDKTIIKGRE